MSPPINLLVTCTKRKTVEVPESLRFQNLKRAKIEITARRWQTLIAEAPITALPARSLYAGDHWSVARTLEMLRLACGSSVQVWTISSGYGLLRLDDRVKPYSATFSRTHPDSIALKAEGEESVEREWWRLLTKCPHNQARNVTSIESIAATYPDSPLIVAASETYLHAIHDDLRSALSRLSDSDLLSVFSAGCSRRNSLAPHLVPFDARLQSLVGGALRSLNIRVARRALSECGDSLPTFSILAKKISRILKQQPDRQQITRHSASDDDVRHFLSRKLCRDEMASHTRLLRMFRDEGFACEQRRFARLFFEVKGELRGS